MTLFPEDLILVTDEDGSATRSLCAGRWEHFGSPLLTISEPKLKNKGRWSVVILFRDGGQKLGPM